MWILMRRFQHKFQVVTDPNKGVKKREMRGTTDTTVHKFGQTWSLLVKREQNENCVLS
jgi:hypothetical protein